MRRALCLLASACLMGGCNQFNKLLNGEPRRDRSYDTTPNVVTVDGVTSFDYDTVYNVATVATVRVRRPFDTDYWTINVYEFSYDATARALHFGKLVAVSGDSVTVENAPVAPVGTRYQIILE